MATARTQDVVFNSYIGYDYSLSLDSKLGCNLANTPILQTYPTAPTASKGTYIFDSNGSTKILSAGGTDDKTSITLDVLTIISCLFFAGLLIFAYSFCNRNTQASSRRVCFIENDSWRTSKVHNRAFALFSRNTPKGSYLFSQT